MNKFYEVIIVGGGIAGLATAWKLRDKNIVLLEADEALGGRIISHDRQPYWLNLGAHIFGGPQSPLGILASRVGVEIVPIKGNVAGVYVNDKLTYGGRVETYPFRARMSMEARWSMISTGIRLWRANRKTRKYYEDPIHGILEITDINQTVNGDINLDTMNFTQVMGTMHPTVENLIRSATNRMTAEPHEMSGYFGAAMVGNLWGSGRTSHYTAKGGVGKITNGIANALGKKVISKANVEHVSANTNSTRVIAQIGDKKETFQSKYVVMATPAYVTRKIVSQLPVDKDNALAQVTYGPFVVMAVLTKETSPMPYDELYAIAVADKTICMFFNEMNPARNNHTQRKSGGSLMLYAGAEKARRLLEKSDAEICDIFLGDAYGMFPELKGVIEETVIHRFEQAYPYWRPGRLKLQKALTRPIGNVFFTGDYIGFPSIDNAAHYGFVVANAIRRKLSNR